MPTPDDRFRYDGYVVDPINGIVTCTYSTVGHSFSEQWTFGPEGRWESDAVRAAVRLLFLLAGVSYYKTSAAPLIDLGDVGSTAAERAFLGDFYRSGLAEFAFRNGLELDALTITGAEAKGTEARPVDYEPAPGRPLIPFGGGIDSIVTVHDVVRVHPEASLFVVHPPEDRFAAIEDAAAVTGLPVRRATRALDPQVRRSAELGFLNGHVPVTAIITAAALVAAVLDQRDAVILSNEWSASVPTLVADGRAVNHQWSKGDEFERRFGELVAKALGPRVSVFSYLRPRTELWVAQRFAALTEYHGTFRSCNRGFHQDPAQRLERWCGRCDKCCFIDLVLAPFMAPADLAAVFGGSEPLDDPANEPSFRALAGLGPEARPFECVGDVGECRAAVVLAAERADRTASALVQQLRAEIVARDPSATAVAAVQGLEPRSPHRIPDDYAPPDLLVRAR
jgi:hypothetical protein